MSGSISTTAGIRGISPTCPTPTLISSGRLSHRLLAQGGGTHRGVRRRARQLQRGGDPAGRPGHLSRPALGIRRSRHSSADHRHLRRDSWAASKQPRRLCVGHHSLRRAAWSGPARRDAGLPGGLRPWPGRRPVCGRVGGRADVPGRRVRFGRVLTLPFLVQQSARSGLSSDGHARNVPRGHRSSCLPDRVAGRPPIALRRRMFGGPGEVRLRHRHRDRAVRVPTGRQPDDAGPAAQWRLA